MGPAIGHLGVGCTLGAAEGQSSSDESHYSAHKRAHCRPATVRAIARRHKGRRPGRQMPAVTVVFRETGHRCLQCRFPADIVSADNAHYVKLRSSGPLLAIVLVQCPSCPVSLNLVRVSLKLAPQRRGGTSFTETNRDLGSWCLTELGPRQRDVSFNLVLRIGMSH